MSEYSRGKKFRPHVADDFDDAILSEAGRERRDAMLVDLQGLVVGEGRRRRVRRRIVRGVSLFVLTMMVSASLVTIWPTSHTPITVTSNPKPESSSLIQIVETNPQAVAAMIAKPTVNLANYYIDDRELVDTLAAIGRPSGLIRKGGEVCLASPVTDPISRSN